MERAKRPERKISVKSARKGGDERTPDKKWQTVKRKKKGGERMADECRKVG